MPRLPEPWFRVSKNAWYVTHNGRKVSLGVRGKANRKTAVIAWHKLTTATSEPDLEPITVAKLINRFLADAEGRVGTETLKGYRLFLLPFADAYAEQPAEDVIPEQAEKYSRKPQWSPSYRHGFLATLIGAFHWAERQRLIGSNPLRGIRKPPKASRGAKALVSEKDHARLVAVAPEPFKAFLRLLWLTGARPGEIASLRAEDIDMTHGLAVLTQHKTAHLGKPRTIFFCSEAVAILIHILEKQPNGLLFPNERGNRMSAHVICQRMRGLCEQAGVNVIAYGYRHTFATDALSRGVPEAQVAALLGHQGTTMLHKHYSHLTSNAKVLHEALRRIHPNSHINTPLSNVASGVS